MARVEAGLREQRRCRNALKRSGLPHHKTLAYPDYGFQPDFEPRRIKDLATLEFVDARTNIVLLGPPGVGKTHVAVAACRAGHSTCFASLDDLVRKARIAEAIGRLDKQLIALPLPGVLVVDEGGYLRHEWEEANMFFQLISRRYERGSTIITSNKSLNEWRAVLGDGTLAINGPSYLLRNRLNLT